MSAEALLTALALISLGAALVTGPVTLAARGTLRASGGVAAMRRYTPAIVPTFIAASLAAVAVTGFLLGGQAAVTTALLALLALMVIMDLAWRWLPLEWTLPTLFLGLATAFVAGDPTIAILGSLVGGGLLFTLRLTFQIARGIDALGAGDIWLAAALGAFLGPLLIGWLLCAAAALGLTLHSLSSLRQTGLGRTRYGVAFGAHLAILAPLFMTF